MSALHDDPERFVFWTVDRHKSKTWNWRVKFWRLQLQLTVHRHGGGTSDRWVLQPHVVYDRKQQRPEPTFDGTPYSEIF